MSIFEFPRLHFRGSARIHAPTGHKNGLVDLQTNTVYCDGEPVDIHAPIPQYHEYLQQLGPQFNATGQWDQNGPFSLAKGWDFGGNGHFMIDAKIVSTQTTSHIIDTHDPVVGRSVDMWGHHNEYLGTTVNRARIFDCDPASNWTQTIMVGHLTFGRQGGSQEVPNMLSAPVEGLQPARWQNFDYLQNLPDHCLNPEFSRASVHQFTVSKEAQDFLWGDEISPAVELLRQAMKQDEVLGLVVQFSLSNMSAPMRPDAPTFWDLSGTIGLWCQGEMHSYPHGRLMIPASKTQDQMPRVSPLGNLSVHITSSGVSLNAITAIPYLGRDSQAEAGKTHGLGPKQDLGDLELRTSQSHQLVAVIPRQTYQNEAYQLTSGIIDAPLASPWKAISTAVQEEGLCLIGTLPNGERQVLLREKEVNLQIEDACLFLEFPDHRNGEDYAEQLKVYSFIRGKPAPVEAIYIKQYYNPKGVPQLRYEFEQDPANIDQTFHFPQSHNFNILEFKPGQKSDPGSFTSDSQISTNQEGQGWLTLRGFQPGTARILLSSDPEYLPWDRDHLDEAELSYDNDNQLNFWAGAGSFAVRVMSNDWDLDDIPQDQVSFDLIFEKILAYYELCFSFMKAEVFSLADKCKVETYARLMWQMCDPNNKDRTYYMPPTRDMSRPKAMLLYKYLQNQHRVGYVPTPTPQLKQPQCTIRTRDKLVIALQQAAELEVAVMLQYIYAAYSIPNYITGKEYVRHGLWTPEQLNIACGDGQEVRNYGMRGQLLTIAHEEMIHFLLVNNILMALGEPFFPANPNFNNINQTFPIEIDLALEPFNASSLQRFIRLEMPDFLEHDLVDELDYDDPKTNQLHSYGSLSELYRQIRDAIETIPDLFQASRDQGAAGGEHHLFLREDFNQKHPDYQLQVDSRDSALFAVDLITEQGEGCHANSPEFQHSHYQQFQKMAAALAQQQYGTQNNHPRPWNPAYPALRNPSLQYQDRNTNVVTVADTRTVMQICDECYFLMMQLMVQHFGATPNASLRRSKLMNASIDIMTGMIAPLGELLMTLPSGKRGKTAGPSFHMEKVPAFISQPTLAYHEMSQRFERLGHQARSCQAIHSTIFEMFDYYAKFFEELSQTSQSQSQLQIKANV